jgi:hypothetical protein
MMLLLFQDNQLSGTIPLSTGSLTKLTGLNLSKNQLNGTIPSSIGLGKKVEIFVSVKQSIDWDNSIVHWIIDNPEVL